MDYNVEIRDFGRFRYLSYYIAKGNKKWVHLKLIWVTKNNYLQKEHALEERINM